MNFYPGRLFPSGQYRLLIQPDRMRLVGPQTGESPTQLGGYARLPDAAPASSIKGMRRLKKKGKMFEEFVNALDDLVFIKDREHRWVFLNDACCRFWGFSREELIGKSDFDIFPKEQAEVYWAKDSEVFRTKKSVLNIEEQTIGGRLYIISTQKSLYRDEASGEEYIVGTIRDITDEQRARDALKESEEQFRHLADSSPNMIFINQMGRISYANSKCSEVMGYTPDEFLSPEFDFISLIAPEHRKTVKASFQRHQRGEEAPAYEYKLVTKDGRRIDSIVTTRLINYRGNTAILGIVTDISAHKKIEEELKEKEEQLLHSQKMEAVGRLAGGIAHDFNNLLTAVLGYAELLIMDPDCGEKALEYAKEIKSAAKRGALLTRQLLAFSKRQVLQPKKLDIDALIKNLENMLRRIIGENIAVSVIQGSRGKLIRADPGQIEQILVNLLVNSKDAMPEGGSVDIETGVEYIENRRCHFGKEVVPGEYVYLEVRDTGVGIAGELSTLVFEPFFTTKELGKGTGLGLATVYGIVNQNRGYLFMDSITGAGTKIRVDFPVYAE